MKLSVRIPEKDVQLKAVFGSNAAGETLAIENGPTGEK